MMAEGGESGLDGKFSWRIKVDGPCLYLSLVFLTP